MSTVPPDVRPGDDRDSPEPASRGRSLRALLTGSRDGGNAKQPLYPQLLRLQHVHPNAWQRAVLGEGMVAAGALLAMADLASAWSLVVLPVAVAGVVKGHDLLAGLLARR